MRGSFSLFRNPNGLGSTTIGQTAKLVSCSAFSTSSSGGGSGGGRGRGASAPTKFDFVAEGADDSENPYSSAGRGHGRGKPLPSTPSLPSYSFFIASNEPSKQAGLDRGRGGLSNQHPEPGNEQEPRPKGPIFLKKDEATGESSVPGRVGSVHHQPVGVNQLPEEVLNVLTGSGRGKPERKPISQERPREENRHLRPRHNAGPGSGPAFDGRRGKGRDETREATSDGGKPKGPKLSRDEAVKKAVRILSKNDEEREEGGRERRKWSRRERSGDDWDEDDDEGEDEDNSLFAGDDADGEKLAQKLGPAGMDELTEAFEEMSTDVLPDPEEEEYLEAVDINYKIELEPEYLMGEFLTNPDINENPPIPLREALEKMKPFLMAYEGIESQEEWEEVMKETMEERLPILKEIVDHYCGLERVTAKRQHGELERVAQTLPASVPNSVKRFTDRAVLTLQSNAGWGFHRKCQYMDKLVDGFSKAYK